jgi:hypothetical protein
VAADESVLGGRADEQRVGPDHGDGDDDLGDYPPVAYQAKSRPHAHEDAGGDSQQADRD